MASPRPVSISGALRLRGDADADEGSRPRRARDRDPSADLGRPAAHRLQSEVTAMPGARVEAPSVVADLDDDLALLDVDPNVGRARLGVPLDVRQRFPRDAEQLGLDGPG